MLWEPGGSACLLLESLRNVVQPPGPAPAGSRPTGVDIPRVSDAPSASPAACGGQKRSEKRPLAARAAKAANVETAVDAEPTV